MIYDERMVAIYHDNIRFAQHERDKKRGGYTTEDDHMPAHHRFYASWSVEKFESWAVSIGEETSMVIRHLLASRRHPEQAFKSCVGILSLSSKCAHHYLNMACRKAWNYDRISYKEVKTYLEDILMQKKLNCDEKQIRLFPPHENLRDTAQHH